MRTLFLPLAFSLVILPMGAYGQAQQARDQAELRQFGTGVLAGVVTTAGESPVPVRRAVLGLSGEPLRTTLLAVTDTEGRFEFRNLPPGRFSLDARKAGFVREVYGASTIGGTDSVQIPVGDGTTDVAMSLARSAAISGQVLMPPGAPVSSIRLQVLRWDIVRGRRQLVSARGGAFTVGGDGRYRIGSLPPGEYVVVAYPSGRAERRLFDVDGPGPIVSLAPVYLPGTVDPSQARAVRVEAGDDRVVDIAMDFVQTGRVEGRVFGADGAPMGGAQVSIVTGLPAVSQMPAARTSADGTFVLPPVVPGAYTIVARGAPPGMRSPPAGSLPGNQQLLPLWASTSISVTPGSHVQGLDLYLQPGRSVRGRVVTLGDGTPVSASSLFVVLAADDDASATIGVPVVQPAADQTFEIPGVAPGRYRLQATVPDVLRNEVFVIGIEAGGRDALDNAIIVSPERDVDVTIALSTHPSVVDVSVRDADGVPRAGRPIVVFPREPAFRLVPSRRVVFTRAGADGQASVRGLPDGPYLVMALMEIPDGMAQTAEWFASLEGAAAAIDVRDGQQTSATLVIAR